MAIDCLLKGGEKAKTMPRVEPTGFAVAIFSNMEKGKKTGWMGLK